VLRFLAALAPAHLLQKPRDTNALHPVFSRPGYRLVVLSPAFFLMLPASSTDLRKILTGSEIGRSKGGAANVSCGEVAIAAGLPNRSNERILGNVKKGAKRMAKQISMNRATVVENDSFSSTTTIAALLFLAAKFPHRQFNSAELSVLSGIGRTALSQIKNASDSPFSLGKCTLQRLDGWLAKHPGFKQQ
jgi:hypothetical protein